MDKEGGEVVGLLEGLASLWQNLHRKVVDK